MIWSGWSFLGPFHQQGLHCYFCRKKKIKTNKQKLVHTHKSRCTKSNDTDVSGCHQARLPVSLDCISSHLQLNLLPKKKAEAIYSRISDLSIIKVWIMTAYSDSVLCILLLHIRPL